VVFSKLENHGFPVNEQIVKEVESVKHGGNPEKLTETVSACVIL